MEGVKIMNELIDFLSSGEMTIVYVVAAIAFILCMMIYIIDKSYEKRKRKHNTKELNKLVEKVTEELELEEQGYTEEPILIPNEPVLQPILDEKIEELEAPKEELVYTDIEPNQEEAKRQLVELTKRLQDEEQEVEEVIENIELTDYEAEQENNAIISLEELVEKSKEMYAANELTQYKDEGNEPISIQDLEEQAKKKVNPEYSKPFVIENVVPEKITKEEISEMYDDKKLHLDDFNTVKVEEPKKFKSSPVISPVYGIEKKETTETMELENTANYDKLDEEIKKTNDFIMTLKELQKHLD